MPTRRHPTTHAFLPLALLLTAAVLVSCGGKRAPEAIPSQTTTQVTPQLEPPPQLPPPVRRVRPVKPSTVKVIDPGEPDDGPKTLYQASQLAKAQKQQRRFQKPIADITDENLHEYSESAEVIILEGDPAAPPPTFIEAPPEPRERDEQYWRDGVLELRMGWRRTLDRIAELELESAALRQRFYAEEDPYVRDSQIKPEWDRVLDRLSQLRDRADRYEQELDQFIETGRQAGAEPGWLAEGWELEPERRTENNVEEFTVHRTLEPPIVNEVEDP